MVLFDAFGKRQVKFLNDQKIDRAINNAFHNVIYSMMDVMENMMVLVYCSIRFQFSLNCTSCKTHIPLAGLPLCALFRGGFSLAQEFKQSERNGHI